MYIDHQYHEARQLSDSPIPTLTQSIVINGTQTLLIVCPTGTVYVTSPGTMNAQYRLDRNVIIILSAICFALICIIAAILLWFRRGIIRRLNQRSGDGHDGDGRKGGMVALEMSATGRTSAPLVGGGGRAGSTRSTPSVYSQPDVERAASPTDQKLPQQRPIRHLMIDSTLRFPLPPSKEPRTAGWVDSLAFGDQKTPSLSDVTFRPMRANRAVSYPSDNGAQYFPHTPDSAIPLIPTFNPVIQQRRQLHTVPEVDSERSRSSLAPSSAADQSRGPSPMLAVTAPPSAYATPNSGSPEVLPSPPPSPASTITSASPVRRGSDGSTSHSNSNSSNGQAQLPNTRPATAVSSHLSVSSTSGSSARFSSLFFAPLGSSPPRNAEGVMPP